MQAVVGQPPAVVYGTVCRINFWVKMTTALGVTQMVIGVSCMVFYMVAYFTCQSPSHFIRYIGVGLITGSVILASGVLGMVSSKRKTRCMITSFLVLSALAAMFALLPMVLGIVGATSSMLDDNSLLMPICQLVFATVEIVVATWSIGVCCQAICCPNATFGHVSTRLPSGLGVTQFISGGDGQHVVLFTSAPTTQSTFLYNMNGAQPPYYLQQGVPTVQLTSQSGITYSAGQHPGLRGGHQSYFTAGVPFEYCAAGDCFPVAVAKETRANADDTTDEAKQLLSCNAEEVIVEGVVDEEDAATPVGEPVDVGYEVEDEQAHLLC